VGHGVDVIEGMMDGSSKRAVIRVGPDLLILDGCFIGVVDHEYVEQNLLNAKLRWLLRPVDVKCQRIEGFITMAG
jgi:hypothetical protein